MKGQVVSLAFPLAGVDVSLAFGQQKASVTPLGSTYDQSFQQERFETTRYGVNVRGFDPLQGRFRGGSRPGLTRHIGTQVSGSNPVQGLGVHVFANITPPGGGSAAATSGRVVTLCAVCNGVLKVASPGSTSWAAVTVASGSFSTTAPVQMTQAYNWMWMVDGTNVVGYFPQGGAGGTQFEWAGAMSAGTLPGTAGGPRPRLICLWNGRVVLSGLKSDPQNWFMSKQGSPLNFDYAPGTPSPQQAVAGNNSNLGMMGDVITGLVPINDQNLLFLGDHTCYLMRGDPMSGGVLQALEPGVGGAWGQAWCVDGEGVVYFLSNRVGVYRFTQFGYPERISSRIDPLLRGIDTSLYNARMLWDDWLQGFHLFLTPLTQGVTGHFFWEKRTQAWWQDQFANTAHNPTAVLTFDANADRRALVGGWDGYVRYLDPAAASDDGTGITSTVVIGPIASGFQSLLLNDLRATLGAGSGSVGWKVYVGSSPEAALAASSPVAASGQWSAGINPNAYVRRSGKAIYLSLTATTPWAVEALRARVAALGGVRERSSR